MKWFASGCRGAGREQSVSEAACAGGRGDDRINRRCMPAGGLNALDRGNGANRFTL